MIKLSDKIKLNDGTITTGAELLDSGKAIVTKEQIYTKHARNDQGFVYWYNLELLENGKPSGWSWRIGQKAYESRAAKGQDKPPADMPATRPADPVIVVGGTADALVIDGVQFVGKRVEDDEDGLWYDYDPKQIAPAWTVSYRFFRGDHPLVAALEQRFTVYWADDFGVISIGDKRKTDAELIELERQWTADPSWELEYTEGFSVHFQHLREYARNAKRRADEAESARLAERAIQLGIPGAVEVVKLLESLERQIAALQEIAA